MTQENLRCPYCTHDQFKGVRNNEGVRLQCQGCDVLFHSEELVTDEEMNLIEVKIEAYEMGFEEFRSAATISAEQADLSYFKETARWSNNLAPELREMAGFQDGTGAGTYTVAPNDGAEFLYDRLVELFDEGARDCLSGADRDPHRHVESLP